MRIAVPREIRTGERRVALVPESVKKLVKAVVGNLIKTPAAANGMHSDRGSGLGDKW